MESELVAEFCKVTGVDSLRARDYLEAAGWDSNLAISNYFEECEYEPENTQPSNPTTDNKPKPMFPPPTSGSRIATFASLAQEASSEEEEGQAFYAGGSERSGQQVLGPGKRKSGNEIVDEMFKSIRKFGGEVQSSSSNRCTTSTLKPFRGAGHVLGSTSDDINETAASADATQAVRETEIRLQLWQTGFTVDGGPMRDYNEPGNQEFLEAIRKGEIPSELRHKAEGKEVHLSVEDRSHEDYVPRRPVVQAFSGAGFRLGNVAPVVHSSNVAARANNAENFTLAVDETKPVTTIQIRLADGSRLTMRANNTHTVGDIRTFIVGSRTEYNTTVFNLMTAFPPKELANDSATLEEENLLNAVIVQKLK